MSYFVNPYNFIRFPEQKAKAYEDKDVHTGVIEYTITTKTPLFIPNSSNMNAYDKDATDKAVDFFSYDNLEGKTDYKEYHEPVIPGSELRGMVRSIYEAITKSCMSVLNSEERPAKRTGEIFKPGLIHRDTNGQLSLVEAEDCLYQEKQSNGKYVKFKDTSQTEKFDEDQKVFFKKENRGKNIKPIALNISEKSANQSTTSGYLIKGMPGPKKHNAHIFIPLKKVEDIGKSDIEGLKMVILNYQSQPNCETSYKQYEEKLSDFLAGKDENYFPVYYSELVQGEKRALYLSPAAITKEISNNNIGTLAGEFVSCKSIEERCPGCDLFGMVGKSNADSMASKLRFSDAKVSKKDSLEMYYDAQVRLPELSSPKLGNTEFYLKRPENAYFWTYDYFIQGEGKIKLDAASLRGRKFYWNQPGMQYPKKVVTTKRNVTVRPVKTESTFCGKVFFNRISDKQLRQILWILNGGDRSEQEDDIVFKLGAAKPLGFGSVQLTVTDVKERKFVVKDGKLCYTNTSSDDFRTIYSYDKCGFDQDCKTQFMNMVSYEKMRGKTIAYPFIEDKRNKENDQSEKYKTNGFVNEGFRWFVKNHMIYPKERGRIQFTNPRNGMPQQRIQNVIGTDLPDCAGSTIVGTVKRYSEDNKKVYIETSDNRELMLHVTVFAKKLHKRVDLRNEFPVGMEIVVKDYGKNENGYQVYEYIRDLLE